MRIVSLLPSLTELVAALGHVDDLVGVTHECDEPPGVEKLPHLTRSPIPTAASSGTIDTMVAEQGGSLYELDDRLLAELRPDLILTQEQCDVCAVNEATVRRTASKLPGSPHVESVNPVNLAGVHAVFRRVGELLGARDRAESLIATFESTAAEIARRRQGKTPRRVLLLEWFDPPFCSGHWNPEIVALAGGVEVIGNAGERSRRISWSTIAESNPSLILLSSCGFKLHQLRAELPLLQAKAEWSGLEAVSEGAVVLIDGTAYFSSPSPRLEASLRIAAAAIDPGSCADLAPSSGWDWLR